MKKSLNFIVFTLILMLFVLPSVFPNPMQNGMDSAVDNSSKINSEYVDIVNQSDLNLDESINNEDLKEEDDDISESLSNSNSNLRINDLDTRTKEKYDEEVRKFMEGKVSNSSKLLMNISNFSHNLQYIVSIVVSFSILGYMIFKCRKTKNN